MSNLAEKYYEGQEVRLECVASKYKYSRVTWTMKNAECSRRMDEKRQQLHDARGGDTAASSEDRAQLIRICEVGGEARDTEHDLVAVLVLTNLTTADTSTLACSAENTAGGGRKSIKRRRLTVRPVIPPTGNIHKSSEHFYSLFIKALLLFYN